MNRLGVARLRVALMLLRRFFTYCRSLSGCARTMSTLHRGVGLFTISKREKDKGMKLSKEFRLANGDRALVDVELKCRLLGDADTVTHEPDSLPYGYLRVSFSGELAPKGVRFGTNASSYGQIVSDMPNALRRVWSRWHLNYMKAGCTHMGGANIRGESCKWTGYNYGQAWLVDPLTLDGALDILRAMGPEHFSTWVVAHDNIAIGVFPSTTEALRYMHDILPYSWEHAIQHEGWQVSSVIGTPELATA